MVQVGWRGVADLEEFEPKDHVVPSGAQSLDDVVVLVEVIEGVFVGVGGLEGCVLFEVDLEIKGFFEEIIFVLFGLVLKDSSYSFISLLYFKEHVVVVQPGID